MNWKTMLAIIVVIAVAIGLLIVFDVPQKTGIYTRKYDGGAKLQPIGPAASTFTQPSEVYHGDPSNETQRAAANKAVVTTSFAHVLPGQYSEVYAVVANLKPGQTVRASLSGPAVVNKNELSQEADENGMVRFTWRITQYGTYTAKVNLPDGETQTPIIVVQ